MKKTVLRVLYIPLAFLLAIVAFAAAKDQGWLSPIGIESSTQDSQVIQAIERTEEVSLMSLGIQGILQKEQSTEILGRSIPGTGEKVFILYKFTAKLGLDNEQVSVAETGEDAYTVTVPDFMFIGTQEPTFESPIEDGGILRWVTPDIDKLELVNDILSNEGKQEYVDSNRDLLEDQTKVFYDGLITSVVPGAEVAYEFAS